MQIDPNLCFDEARGLGSKQRAELLAAHPVHATTIFHRRCQSILENFLFGETKPFQEIDAFIGRIEQQASHSPHLHMLLWTKNKSPSLTGNEEVDSSSIARFVELFSTALLPPDIPTSNAQVPRPPQKFPLPVYQPLPSEIHTPPIALSGAQRHAALASPYNPNVFDA